MNLSTHRILYTGDSNYLFASPTIYRASQGPFTAKHVHDHIRKLAESGVDTYLLNPNAQRAFYPSKVIPRITDGYRRGDREFVRNFARHCVGPNASEAELNFYADRLLAWMNPMLDLEEAGIDWLVEAIHAARQHGISIWASVRMNDMHESDLPRSQFLNCPLFADDRNRLRGDRPDIPGATWTYFSGLNYEVKAVRDYMFAQIRELVEDYQFTGLELDWLRNPLCCEPNASQQTIDRMTAWIGEVRALTQDRSRKIGKPYPLGIRTPGDLGTMRAIGLDIPALVRQRLIDFVSPSNFWQTTWDLPFDRLRTELGNEVTLYGVIEDAPNWLQCAGADRQIGASGTYSKTKTRLLSASAPLMRGNAAGKLVLGAQGIEFFNFFATEMDVMSVAGPQLGADYAAIRQIDRLEFLRGKPKGYTFSTPFGACYISYWERPEQLPVILEPLWRRAFRLPMCAEPADAGLELTVQLVVEDRGSLPPLGVSFNGCWPTYQGEPTEKLLFPVLDCTHHAPGHRALNYRLPIREIRDGWNEIVVFNGSPKRASVQERRENSAHLVSIELAVK